MKAKLLMVLDHAPNYREPFLDRLSRYYELTVIARPCSEEGLTPPQYRAKYKYIEGRPFGLFGVSIDFVTIKYAISNKFHILCFDLNVRRVDRIFIFLIKKKTKLWVWWGPFFGRSNNRIINKIKTGLASRASACLTYNSEIAKNLCRSGVPNAKSFNNTQSLEADFVFPKFNVNERCLNILFVGRVQKRKRLERIIDLAARREDVVVRIVGPGSLELDIPSSLIVMKRVQVFGEQNGEELIKHFEWSHIVGNPGHVGLLVMNAAQHGRGIVVDSVSDHAPEYLLAKEANQPFIDFSCESDVDDFIDFCFDNPGYLYNLARRLQDVARSKYTIEHMVGVHVELFDKLLENDTSW